MQHLRASGSGWSLKAFQKIDLLSPHDDIAHEGHTLNSSFSKMRNLISDSGARQYCQSTSETIFTYRTLLRELQQRGISQIIEVGPGLVSVVAFANALLHKRLLYSAFEANQMFSDSLRVFCRDLQLSEQIRNDVFTLDKKGNKSECLIFEHSLEDWFLYEWSNHHTSGDLAQAGNPLDLLSFDLGKATDQFSHFLHTALAHLARSSYGAVIFHHYLQSRSDDLVRNAIDGTVSTSLAFREFANAGWNRLAACHRKSLQLECWVAYRRSGVGT